MESLPKPSSQLCQPSQPPYGIRRFEVAVEARGARPAGGWEFDSLEHMEGEEQEQVVKSWASTTHSVKPGQLAEEDERCLQARHYRRIRSDWPLCRCCSMAVLTTMAASATDAYAAYC